MILVTGASGNWGGELAHLLAAKNIPFVAAAANPDSLRSQQPGWEVRPFDFLDPATFGPALAGVSQVALVRPPQLAKVKTEIFPFVEACAAAGVEQVVFLSLQGVERNRFTPHYKIERHIRACGLGFTFIRPSFFMQNLSGTHRDDIRRHSCLRLPAGRGRTSFVDVRDVAEASLVALEHPAGHLGKAYELTGSEALTYFEVADILSAVLGRRITYRPIGALRFFLENCRAGKPAAFALVMTALYTVCRLGWADTLTDTLQTLLGRAPRTFRTFAEDHRAVWE